MRKIRSDDGRCRVAVVEDDPFMAKIIVGTIRQRGHEVVLYPDGAEALLAVPSGDFDLVLTDLGMPRLDGLSFLRALRASRALVELPVIVLSGRDKEEEIIEAFDAGATDYLVKPIQPALLAAKLSLHLRPVEARSGVNTLRDSSSLTPKISELPCQFGAWRLVDQLGHGGSGAVYRAEGPEGTIAIKLIDPDKARSADLTRYYREVAALSLVKSPHVVGVKGYGKESGYHYLSMELIKGGTVEHELHDGTMSRARIVHLGLCVVRGIQALSTRHITHRDIKPSNILVREETGDGVLADLGLAKQAGDASHTSEGSIVGTLHYLAPEVVLGTATAGSASDRYSLGATLYHLAAGFPPFRNPPFPNASPMAILKNIVLGEAQPLVAVRTDGIGETLSQLVADLMNVDPGLRPSLDETESRLMALLPG